MNFKISLTRTHALLGAVLPVALLTVFVNTAQAHYIYIDRFVGEFFPNCVRARLETSHGGTGAGYYKTELSAERCLLRYTMATRQNHYKWNAVSAVWELCTATGFKVNDDGTNKVTLIIDDKNPTPACGEGYYQNFSDVCFWQQPSEWKCTMRRSGWHYLPDR